MEGGHDSSGGWVVGFLGGIPGKRKGKRGEGGRKKINGEDLMSLV